MHYVYSEVIYRILVRKQTFLVKIPIVARARKDVRSFETSRNYVFFETANNNFDVSESIW